MKKRITRNALVEMVVDSIPCHYANDLPAIRQALNDTADAWRKDGFTVGDYCQDTMTGMVIAGLNKRREIIETI